MKLIGKDNGHMMAVKFLYSAVNELNNKSEVTVTDFLALRAFVKAEQLDWKNESGELNEEARAYLSLLGQMAADLSVPYHGFKSAISDAHCSAHSVFHSWGLDKEE